MKILSQSLHLGRRALLLLAMLMASSLPAQAQQDWPSSARVSDGNGRLLYTEEWLSASSEDELMQWDIVYRSAEGEFLGRRGLNFAADRPYLPQVRVELGPDEWIRLSKGKGEDRWVRETKFPDRPRSERGWPDIRQHSLIDIALLRYLVEQREALLRGEIDAVSHFRLDSGRAQQYKIKLQQLPGQGGEELLISLIRDGWFSRPETYLQLRLQRQSGHMLSLVMQQAMFAPQTTQLPIIKTFLY